MDTTKEARLILDAYQFEIYRTAQRIYGFAYRQLTKSSQRSVRQNAKEIILSKIEEITEC